VWRARKNKKAKKEFQFVIIREREEPLSKLKPWTPIIK
jgi:hypothetical protein